MGRRQPREILDPWTRGPDDFHITADFDRSNDPTSSLVMHDDRFCFLDCAELSTTRDHPEHRASAHGSPLDGL